MNGAVLGAKCFVSAANKLQAVVPTPSGLSGPFQSNAAPPQAWTSIPRWVLYQAPRALGSFDLKKIPPIPVTRFMAPPVRDGGGSDPGGARANDISTSLAVGYAGPPSIRCLRPRVGCNPDRSPPAAAVSGRPTAPARCERQA